ncbi:hypothetical protein CDAR_570481 [Caerostris darwini]|uniref:Uncharacterized protein n=1 Tax=Caerostris darwini TaxID=1538125 RepID=A0AAV4TIG3_9ARAC|nr:hypothetical protein CDAR_570481 [Caerostris darwini]
MDTCSGSESTLSCSYARDVPSSVKCPPLKCPFMCSVHKVPGLHCEGCLCLPLGRDIFARDRPCGYPKCPSPLCIVLEFSGVPCPACFCPLSPPMSPSSSKKFNLPSAPPPLPAGFFPPPA